MKKFEFKITNIRKRPACRQAGMTYVELIVVLSIFATMSSIILFNYGAFQAKIDIKNLSSDIALRLVEAQRSSVSGKFPPPVQLAQIGLSWKPSYGLYINMTLDNKSFIYFTDIDQNGDLTTNLGDFTCTGSGECLEKITITKQNYISALYVVHQDGTVTTLSDLTITFKRPGSEAIIKSSGLTLPLSSPIAYAQINVAHSQNVYSVIYIYPSGRIQVN